MWRKNKEIIIFFLYKHDIGNIHSGIYIMAYKKYYLNLHLYTKIIHVNDTYNNIYFCV